MPLCTCEAFCGKPGKNVHIRTFRTHIKYQLSEKERAIRTSKKCQYLPESVSDLTNNDILIDEIEETLHEDELQKNEQKEISQAHKIELQKNEQIILTNQEQSKDTFISLNKIKPFINYDDNNLSDSDIGNVEPPDNLSQDQSISSTFFNNINSHLNKNSCFTTLYQVISTFIPSKLLNKNITIQ